MYLMHYTLIYIYYTVCASESIQGLALDHRDSDSKWIGSLYGRDELMEKRNEATAEPSRFIVKRVYEENDRIPGACVRVKAEAAE